MSGLCGGDRLRDRPDETMEDVVDTAVLLEKIEGEEEVARMDALLSRLSPVEILIGFE